MIMKLQPRREFIKTAGQYAGAALIGSALSGFQSPAAKANRVQVCGHLWVYASRYPPDWDCTPILEQVFSDFRYAGIEGVEVMESILHHNDVVTRGKELIDKYKVPITGSSYYGDMWNKDVHG